MRKLIMAVLAMVLIAGAVSACAAAAHRDGRFRGGIDSID